MSEANTFTPREMQMMAFAWLCFTEHPKVDFEKLARLAGMTNKGSAANAWRKIRDKIQANGDMVAGGTVSTNNIDADQVADHKPASTAVPKKRGRKAANEKKASSAKKPKSGDFKQSPQPVSNEDNDVDAAASSDEEQGGIPVKQEDDGIY